MSTGPTEYLSLIDEIEKIRGKNNKNWMDLLRLAFAHAPQEAAEIVAEIYKHDHEISDLAGQLVASARSLTAKSDDSVANLR